MATRKRGPARWIVLGLALLLGGVAFFSLRGLSRTPAKIDPDKLATDILEKVKRARRTLNTRRSV